MHAAAAGPTNFGDDNARCAMSKLIDSGQTVQSVSTDQETLTRHSYVRLHGVVSHATKCTKQYAQSRSYCVRFVSCACSRFSI